MRHHLTPLLLGIMACASALAATVSLEDFDSLTPAQLAARTSPLGTGVVASLIATDERAGRQNLLLTANVDPAHPVWHGVKLTFPTAPARPQTLSFWYRGDRATRLYLIVVDSKGQRGDYNIGQEARPGEWTQAIISLAGLHVPNATPPHDRMTPVDFAALEIYPAPGSQPEKGTYRYQVDDLAVDCAAAVPVSMLMNPVANGDFSQLSPDGKAFTNWNLGISRNALCTLTVDRTGGREGSPCPVFHNESPISPHVYGRFTQRVTVVPQMAYRLSFWCKGEAVSGGDHWTDWKTYQLGLPSGTFGWTKRETELVTAADQTALELGLNLDNTAGKIWVDDVQLAPDYTEGRAGAARLCLWAPHDVRADRDELPCRVVWGDLPPTARVLRLAVVAGGQTLGSSDVPLDKTAGETLGRLKLAPTAEGEGTVLTEARDAAGKVLVTVQRPVALLSEANARRRLAELRTQLGTLETKLDGWKARGLPTDYPQVTATVVSNFLPWVAEDLDHGELARALQQIGELAGIMQAALAEADNPPPAAALRAPRYTGGLIAIQGGHFTSAVRWPDGRTETRPVFFNGYGHFGAVRRDVEKFPAYGLNLFQVEFGPSSVVKPDLSTDLGAVNEFVKLLDRGQQAGVAVNLLISPHYMPGWVYEQHPEVGDVDGGFLRYDIDAPATRQVLEAYLKAIIPVLRGHPALHSICLSNEPVYVSAPKSAYNLAKWHAWLSERHGTIAQLNRAWGTTFAGFDAVPLHASDDLKASPELYDWVSFNNQRFAAWHRWMADLIHSMAPEIPVHAKIMNLPFSRNTLNLGNDPEQFCDLSQIAGNDAFNGYLHEDTAEFGNQWRGEYQWYDLLRSMRGQPVFNSENHVVADRNWRPVPGSHMRNLVWEGALHGLGASTVWVWERTYDNKSDFAGSIMHRPALCDAHGRAALDLMRLAPEMVALQDAPARVAILYSICNQVWNPNYMTELGSAYQTLTYLGEKVDFITGGQLAAGQGKQYRVLVAPGVTNLEAPAWRALKDFARLPGRTLVTSGPKALAADEYNRPHGTPGPKAVNVPSATDETRLRTALTAALGDDCPVRLLDAATVAAPHGVGWRWARDGNRWLVDVCNFTRQPVRLRVEVRGARQLTNLFTARPVTGTFELGMMESVLIESH